VTGGLYVSYIVLPVTAESPVSWEPRRYAAPLLRIGEGVDALRFELPRDPAARIVFARRLIDVLVEAAVDAGEGKRGAMPT
jgi:hypothetical protein